ncbi:LacI family DNA-binding transcriptional regulator [Anaerocolumna aminovalerica]|jgi:LacI family transcriptional regulator|uniref:Transcriptional regulator, LacI family n=1 Tax=Anaerocolumna aminovalerica TaxID=1527 RepID=A0A1I5FJ90_9FIRM|nr:LacI family DNA-binding transcriptional regulator [Anaerocolumna aminovalerica]MBU5330974.1 LacI family transcriptional regulator [Anaerocolumna aminovalerica]MDU6264690.1 LacI family DNA-binding transcriptional regulator [Anaerocolumna aminovalerica]SFO23815.1 transcriptional regulator, LacI family [Anaerocolumna aminovalerica]
MASLKDIAAKCKVSVATVSKALNDQSDIGKETKENIRKAAEEMGYFPNSAARMLKTKRSNNIGILFIDKMHSGLAHEYFSSVLENLKSEAEKRGYDITFISQNIGQQKVSYLEHCRYRNYDGVVIASVDYTDPMVVELVTSDLPVVTIDHVYNGKTAILSDNVKAVEDLVNYIYQRGHRKIAFIHGEDTSVTQKRLASFYKTCMNLGIKVPKEYVKTSYYHDPKTTGKLTRELLECGDPPTCIMFPDDFSFIGGMNVIDEKGLRIPEDISVAGFDGILLSQVLKPKLTTVKQDSESIGREAAAKLIDWIENPKTSLATQVLIQGKLLEGKTVKMIETN